MTAENKACGSQSSSYLLKTALVSLRHTTVFYMQAAADGEEPAKPAPKAKNPLDLLPPSKMVLDSWKRLYSNTPASQFKQICVNGLWNGADIPNSPTSEVKMLVHTCKADFLHCLTLSSVSAYHGRCVKPCATLRLLEDARSAVMQAGIAYL